MEAHYADAGMRKADESASIDIRKRTPHCPHCFRTVRKVCGRRAEAKVVRKPPPFSQDADADVRIRIADANVYGGIV
ncbi:hypothetical protein AAVH_40392, partial [Aphelenchoides avenae]